MILLNIVYKIWSYNQLLWCSVVRSFPPILLLCRHLIISRHICIIYMKYWPILLTDRHLLILSHICIIGRQWGPLMITGRHMLTGNNLLNIRQMIQSSSSIVVWWIFFLYRVILVPLNILITLCVTTLIFVSVCDFFVLVSLSTSLTPIF